MTLTEQLRTALAAIPPFTSGHHALALDENDLHLSCELLSLDTIGCEFGHLAVTCGRLSSAGIDELKRVSEALSARITYLLEPIHPIEVDATGCVVQMRSNPPHRDEERTSYYELLVRRGGELSLRRWSKPPAGQRQPLPAQVTREVLLRLTGDFAAVA